MDNPFYSFWSVGFECADHRDHEGRRRDMLAATGHQHEQVATDYAALAALNIFTVREGLGWGRPDFVRTEHLWHVRDAAAQHGIQIIWDLCHYGFPDGVSPLDPDFTGRFVAYVMGVRRQIRQYQPTGPLPLTLINEVSWLAHFGACEHGTVPYAPGAAGHIKYCLMRAYIAAARALKNADPAVVIVSSEPLEYVAGCQIGHGAQWGAMDALTGRFWPELGGHPDLLDIVGLNYYPSHQRHAHGGHFEPRPLRALLGEAADRYERPVFLAETGACGEARPGWIRYVANEAQAALDAGIPLLGVCLYPVLDGLWSCDTHCPNSGLFDAPGGDWRERALHEPTAAALREAQLLTA